MKHLTFALGLLGLAVLATGCGPLAAPLDQGTDPAVTLILGGEARQGRPPAALSEADLAVVSGDPTTMGAAGIDVLVSDTPVDGFTTVSGTRPYVKKVGGYRIAVFGASPARDDRQTLLREVRAAGERADFVVVYLRWPATRDACPDASRRSLTRALVETGADAVVGTGPVQPGGFVMEGTGFVHYGLGALNGGDGGLLTLKVTRNTVHDASWAPHSVRGPLASEPLEKSLRTWRERRSSCPGLTEGAAALRQ